MKRKMCLTMLTLMGALAMGGPGGNSGVCTAEAAYGKKAILVVSFGTTHADTRKLTIDVVAEKLRLAFPDYELRNAFTSRIVIKRLADNDGIKIDTEKQALDKLKVEGFTEVIIQPLHIVAGEEYEKVCRAAEPYIKNKSFAKLSIGRPVLYYMGQEEKPDDYLIAIQAIQSQAAARQKDQAVVWMGHGGVHTSNAAYALLQMKMEDAGLKNHYVYTVESYPMLDNVMAKLRRSKTRNVLLMPFMLVAGDHAKNDMAGDEDDSAKTVLTKAGFKAETYLHGLGENIGIQNIYVQHVKDAIAGKYSERSKDKPEIPVIE